MKIYVILTGILMLFSGCAGIRSVSYSVENKGKGNMSIDYDIGGLVGGPCGIYKEMAQYHIQYNGTIAATGITYIKYNDIDWMVDTSTLDVDALSFNKKIKITSGQIMIDMDHRIVVIDLYVDSDNGGKNPVSFNGTCGADKIIIFDNKGGYFQNNR